MSECIFMDISHRCRAKSKVQRNFWNRLPSHNFFEGLIESLLLNIYKLSAKTLRFIKSLVLKFFIENFA